MEKCVETYIQIIDDAKKNQPIFTSKIHPGYAKHHPIPRSFRKIKIKHDITQRLEMHYTVNETVFVTNRVHFELHILLTKMFPERSQEWFKMINALDWFRGKRKGQFDITPEEYEYLCEHRTRSDEHKINIGISRQGFKANDNTKILMSEATTTTWKDPTIRIKRILGMSKKRSKEGCENIKTALSIPETKKRFHDCKMGVKHFRAKKVFQIKNNVVIACFDSLADASRATGISYQNIWTVCKNKRTHAGGFCWKFVINVSHRSLQNFAKRLAKYLCLNNVRIRAYLK